MSAGFASISRMPTGGGIRGGKTCDIAEVVDAFQAQGIDRDSLDSLGGSDGQAQNGQRTWGQEVSDVAGGERDARMAGDQIPGVKNPPFSGFLAFLKLMSTTANSMGLFRGRQSGFTQAFSVVITWRRGRNGPGLGDAASILGMSDA
ncbi:hypothetical protein OKW11_005279 [Pseudomonas baetica]|nr:hypothetical protein [Pseudomonas baetica]